VVRSTLSGEERSGVRLVACSLLIDPALSVNVNVSLSRKEIGTIDINLHRGVNNSFTTLV
jgi:hypothetical protein